MSHDPPIRCYLLLMIHEADQPWHQIYEKDLQRDLLLNIRTMIIMRGKWSYLDAIRDLTMPVHDWIARISSMSLISSHSSRCER